MHAQKSFLKLLVAAFFLSGLCLPKAVPAGDSETVVEFFEALEAEQIEVQFIPFNATKANVIIENTTNVALTIELPDAFAAVPILAQLGGPQQNGQQGGGQSVGGGVQGGGGHNKASGLAINLVVVAMAKGSADSCESLPRKNENSPQPRFA